jgi:hypothetical protein
VLNVQAGVVDNVGDVDACGLCVGMVDEQATAVGDGGALTGNVDGAQATTAVGRHTL